VTGRGGQGIWNMEMGGRNGAVVAAFPVRAGEELMLVSDGGQTIRMPADEVRIAGRKTLGVTLFRLSADERVVSAASLVPADAADAAVDAADAAGG
jgi:DNA gyrase subunit A